MQNAKVSVCKGTNRCIFVTVSLLGSLELLLFLLLDRAAYQRTVNLGKRFLLEWCCTEIPNTSIDPRGPFLDL